MNISYYTKKFTDNFNAFVRNRSLLKERRIDLKKDLRLDLQKSNALTFTPSKSPMLKKIFLNAPTTKLACLAGQNKFLSTLLKTSSAFALKKGAISKFVSYSLISCVGSGIGLPPLVTAISLVVSKNLFQSYRSNQKMMLPKLSDLPFFKNLRFEFLNSKNSNLLKATFQMRNLTQMRPNACLPSKNFCKVTGIALIALKIYCQEIGCDDLASFTNFSEDLSREAWNLEDPLVACNLETDSPALEDGSQTSVQDEENFDLNILTVEKGIADPEFRKFSRGFLNDLCWKVFKIFASAALIHTILSRKTSSENKSEEKDKQKSQEPENTSKASRPKFDKAETLIHSQNEILLKKPNETDRLFSFADEFPALDPNLGCTFYN